ncbi:MAG: ASCH domain-containing protein [Proteobacteria bacterium]|nr:ASCH domain-containing protein [Pseudomonadota bacterium]
MAILNLTLKKKWFDLIASGQKTVEYREFKPYWVSRLMANGAIRQDFTEVHFRNGHSRNAPFIRVKLHSLTVYRNDFIAPMHGEEITADKYFLISLGPVLELRA